MTESYSRPDDDDLVIDANTPLATTTTPMHSHRKRDWQSMTTGRSALSSMRPKKLPRLFYSPLFWLLCVTVSLSLFGTTHHGTRQYLAATLRGGRLAGGLKFASEHGSEADIYADFFPNMTLPDVFNTRPNQELGRRLVAFLKRPIMSHDDAKDINEANCPRKITDQLVLPGFDGRKSFWIDVDRAQIARKRAVLVRWLEDKLETGQLSLENKGRTGGRGIVVAGGNMDTAQRLIRLLKHLRYFGTSLPVEIWHFPGEMQDEDVNTKLRSLGATLRQSTIAPHSDRNYQIKVYAVIDSAFDEVLYLDSDNLPLRDPSHLFESRQYKTHHAVFWPDAWKDHGDSAIWRIFGRECTLADWQFESGQLLIDKRARGGLIRAALWLAAGMCADSGFYGEMVLGDKDTFRWGWDALDLDYGRSPKMFGALGHREPPENGRFCGTTMVQYDLDVPAWADSEPPLFIHANMLKWNPGLPWENTFTTYKVMKNNILNDSSLLWGHYTMYGICTDIVWNEHSSEEERDANEIVEIPIEYAEAGAFEGFRDRWRRLSGMD